MADIRHVLNVDLVTHNQSAILVIYRTLLNCLSNHPKLSDIIAVWVVNFPPGNRGAHLGYLLPCRTQPECHLGIPRILGY